jgi:HSP20 family protein
MGSIPFRNKRGSETANLRESLADLRCEVSRVVDNLLREPMGWAERALGLPGYPPVDMCDTADQVVVRAEVPGIDPAELEITVSGNQLTLAGERSEPVEAHEQDEYLREIRYGTFHRQVALPSPVDAERVTAECRNGIVIIRLPKQFGATSRRVEIVPQD